MVNRKQRLEMAERLRHFASGLLSVDEWEERSLDLTNPDDPVLSEIRWAMWFTYDDFRTKRLRANWQLKGESRRVVARCILFLYSDSPYRWQRTSWKERIMALLRFERPRCYREQGDEQCWPFFSCTELETAKQKPPFLAASRI